MADEEAPAVESGNANKATNDPEDEGFSTFLEYLESPGNNVPGAAILGKDIVEGGAKLVGHFLQPEEEEENDKDKVAANSATPKKPSSSPTKYSPSPDTSKSYNDLIKEKQDAKKSTSQKKKKSDIPPATTAQLLSFLPTTQDKTLLVLGVVFGILNGLVYPALAYVFSNSFADLGKASEGLEEVRKIAFTFVGVGVYAFTMAALQNFLFAIVSHRAADNFKKRWFSALLRQDAAFHDVLDRKSVV